MKTNSLFRSFLAIAVAGAMLTSCGDAGKNANTASVDLSGAGATFPEPFYTMVFDCFNDSTGNTVAYGGIGSGGGVRNLKDQTVDFAASDAFLSDEEMAEIQLFSRAAAGQRRTARDRKSGAYRPFAPCRGRRNGAAKK